MKITMAIALPIFEGKLFLAGNKVLGSAFLKTISNFYFVI